MYGTAPGEFPQSLSCGIVRNHLQPLTTDVLALAVEMIRESRGSARLFRFLAGVDDGRRASEHETGRFARKDRCRLRLNRDCRCFQWYRMDGRKGCRCHVSTGPTDRSLAPILALPWLKGTRMADTPMPVTGFALDMAISEDDGTMVALLTLQTGELIFEFATNDEGAHSDGRRRSL
jgi:hypothetical protein